MIKRLPLLLIPVCILAGCSGGTSAPEDKDFFSQQKEAMEKNKPDLNASGKKQGMRKTAPKPGEKPDLPGAPASGSTATPTATDTATDTAKTN